MHLVPNMNITDGRASSHGRVTDRVKGSSPAKEQTPDVLFKSCTSKRGRVCILKMSTPKRRVWRAELIK